MEKTNKRSCGFLKGEDLGPKLPPAAAASQCSKVSGCRREGVGVG